MSRVRDVSPDDKELGSTQPLRALSRAPKPGSTFMDRFTLEYEVGRGGVGVVYAVLVDGRPPLRALKIVPFGDDLGLKRVRREGAILDDLVGPHFVRVLESGVVAPHAYVLMDLLEGEDLQKRLARIRRFPAPVLLKLSAQLASALSFAHAKGYVHRDLKPSNIFLERLAAGDSVKLLDFGLAKHVADDSRLTESGVLLGSPNYMAPEQIERARQVDHRADLWSYGVLLYRALSGMQPFNDTGALLLAHIQSSPPTPIRKHEPTLPEEVDRFFEVALAKRPADRFATALEQHRAFAEAIKPLLPNRSSAV
jgi:eukaryotic-like serine/threonine-protein kinase